MDISLETCIAALESWQLTGHDNELPFTPPGGVGHPLTKPFLGSASWQPATDLETGLAYDIEGTGTPAVFLHGTDLRPPHMAADH
jgi:hypothetical protein